MAQRIEAAVKSAGDGKLVRACVEIEDGVARTVTYTGDFFLEPAEFLDHLSEAVSGATRGDVGGRVQGFFREHPDHMLLGATTDDFVTVVVKALDRAAGGELRSE